MDIYLATSNPHKADEFANLFAKAGLDIKVHSAASIGGMPPVEETEFTFEGNARLKAYTLKQRLPGDGWVLAEDSGLCVDYLNGEPGVRSARYAGESVDSNENINKLLASMDGADDRQARFVCSMILIHPSIGEIMFQGSVRGEVAIEPRGDQGFGYDPIFIPAGQSSTFAQLGAPVKSQLSHRAMAVSQLIEWLALRNT